MKKTNLFILCLSLLTINLLTINALAQTPVGPISGGVVNGKARSLAKPAYPPAAKAVRASGAVNIQVIIDENGDVISATAVSGHPLLRAASEKAARESKFAPTMLQGVAVKVMGTIVYNFVAPDSPASAKSLNWWQIGYKLGKADALQFFPENSFMEVLQNVPQEWINENEKLSNAVAPRTAPLPSDNSEKTSVKTPDNPSIESKDIDRGSPAGIPKTGIFIRGNVSVDGGVFTTNSGRTKEEEAEIIKEMIPLLRNRLLENEVRNWYFNAGLTLGKLAYSKDSTVRRNTIEVLRRLQFNTPAKLSPVALENIQRITAIYDKPEFTTDDQRELNQRIAVLQTICNTDDI